MVLYPLAAVLLAQLGIILLVIIFYQRLQKKRLIRELESLQQNPVVQEPYLNEAELQITPGFDREQAALLLSRIDQANQELASEAPAVRDLCKQQKSLIASLSSCLDLSLPQSASQQAAPQQAAPQQPVVADEQDDTGGEEEDILSQAELDAALGEGPGALEGLDEELEGLEGLDDLEDDKELQGGVEELESLEDMAFDDSDPEVYDPLVKSEKAPDLASASDEKTGKEKEKGGELPEDTLQQTLDNLEDFDFSDLEAELLKDEDRKPNS